jgi:predicted nuclease of predicted toxin-antitoxin system
LRRHSNTLDDNELGARLSRRDRDVLFLIDEDVVVGVGRLLASEHDVEYIRDVFGPSTKDPEVIRYAKATGRVLVTADRPLANRLRQTRTVRCLFLRDLRSSEEARTSELMAVILAELGLLGARFLMEIAMDYYKVAR